MMNPMAKWLGKKVEVTFLDGSDLTGPLNTYHQDTHGRMEFIVVNHKIVPWHAVRLIEEGWE